MATATARRSSKGVPRKPVQTVSKTEIARRFTQALKGMIVLEYEPYMQHVEGDWTDDDSEGHFYSVQFNFDANDRDDVGNLTLDDRQGDVCTLFPKSLRKWAARLIEMAETVESEKVQQSVKGGDAR
jgi:hypothetical protein